MAPVTIIDTVTTIEEVMLLQGHNMNTLTTAAAARIFSDDLINTNINNVVRFVYANSREDIEENMKLFCINTLSKYELNNIMFEAGYLDGKWEFYDTFDKEAFNEMVRTYKDDPTGGDIDVIPTFRGQFQDYGEFY